MSILKLPDLNFKNSTYFLFDENTAAGDATVGGSANSITAGTLMSRGVSNDRPTYGFPGLYLFKGTPYTQSDLDTLNASTTAISALTSIPRYSDLLVQLPIPTYSTSKNVWSLKFTPTAAIASGAATWFLLGRHYNAGSPAIPAVFMSGTVGAIGSGADLEIYTTNIVAGTVYKQPAFNITFPNSLSV